MPGTTLAATHTARVNINQRIRIIFISGRKISALQFSCNSTVTVLQNGGAAEPQMFPIASQSGMKTLNAMKSTMMPAKTIRTG